MPHPAENRQRGCPPPSHRRAFVPSWNWLGRSPPSPGGPSQHQHHGLAVTAEHWGSSQRHGINHEQMFGLATLHKLKSPSLFSVLTRRARSPSSSSMRLIIQLFSWDHSDGSGPR